MSSTHHPVCSIYRKTCIKLNTEWKKKPSLIINRANHPVQVYSNLEFGPVVQEMLFKDISYLELWQPLCSVDWNHLCNFTRRHHEEQSCEIILNLDQWFRRKCCLKVFLIWSSCSPFIQQSVTICAILFEGIKRNNYVKLFWIWVSGSGDVV